MGGGSGGGSSGAGWTLMLLPAVDGEILAEYWTDTNATPVEVTAGQSAKISASKIYLSIMCDGEPVSALDIPVLFDGSTAKYDTQNECYTLSASSGTHTVQVGTVTLTISPSKVGLMRPGDRATFTATVSPANLSVIWSVDGPGNLAGNGLTATYTATQAGAVQVAAAVDMTNAGSSVSFTVSEPIVKIRRHRMRDDGTYEIVHHETGAGQVVFADGETFQAKLDAGKLNGADGKSAYQQAVDAGYTGTEAAFYAALVSMKDAPFLPIIGGMMAGNIMWECGAGIGIEPMNQEPNIQLVSGPDGNTPVELANIAVPTHVKSAANKEYVDAETAKCLPLVGGTMTGPIYFSDGGAALAGSQIDDALSVVLAEQADAVSPEYANLNVAVPIDYWHAVNKNYVDSRTLVFQGKAVPASAWVADSTYSAQGYGWRAAVACTDVTASHRPDVTFMCADAVSGNFAPIANSYAGGVYIYCKTKPTTAVVMPSIVCIKGA